MLPPWMIPLRHNANGLHMTAVVHHHVVPWTQPLRKPRHRSVLLTLPSSITIRFVEMVDVKAYRCRSVFFLSVIHPCTINQ